jgi:hypothetical protein
MSSLLKPLMIIVSSVMFCCYKEEQIVPSAILPEWTLNSIDAKTRSMCCFDPPCDYSTNPVFETLLGLEDDKPYETSVKFNAPYFEILKDQKVVMHGSMTATPGKFMLYYKTDSLELNITSQHADSLVLQTKGYSWISDVRIVFRRDGIGRPSL